MLDHCSADLDATEAAFEDYAGEHKSVADFAQEITEETTESPERLAPYIDYEAMARDMVLGGDLFTVELGLDEVLVFWSR